MNLLKPLPIEKKLGRQNTWLNACGIRASSDVPTIYNDENPIQIYAYICYVNCKIFMKNCLAVVWVQGKCFQLDVSVEIL